VRPHPHRPAHATSFAVRNLTAQRAPQPPFAFGTFAPLARLPPPGRLCLFTRLAWTMPASALLSAQLCGNCDSFVRGAGGIAIALCGVGRARCRERFGFNFCPGTASNGAHNSGDVATADEGVICLWFEYVIFFVDFLVRSAVPAVFVPDAVFVNFPEILEFL